MRNHRNKELDKLLQVALQVTDGLPIDWSLLAEESPASAHIVEKLRKLELVADLFRLPASEEDGVLGAQPLRTDALFHWGHLHALELIGRGGYGEVFRAFDDALQREVALKLLHADSGATNADLLAEARRSARIRHRNVVTVHGADMHDERVGIWFDLLRGPTLEDRLQAPPAIEPEEAISILLDVCSALGAVHDAGLIYGDLKASNVVLDARGKAVLCDFGSSRPAEASGGAFVRSGSPLTLPPEAFTGSEPGIAGDIYAVGVLFFRLLTRVHPVDASTLDALIAQHEQRKKSKLRELRPDLPAEWHAFSDRLLAWDPEKRFATTASVKLAAAKCIERWRRVRSMTSPHPNEAAGAHHLPRPAGAFIGRRKELQDLARALHEHRHVSLVGPPGCGKTRLAIETAAGESGSFPDGLHFVDLLTVTDPDRIPEAIAEALRIAPPRDGELAPTLRNVFDRTNALVILDNCEHLREGVHRLLPEIHSTESRTHLLLTSREVLGLPAERVHVLEPLPYPPDTTPVSPQVIEYEAVELFVDRVQRILPEFRLRADNAEALCSICRQVDGLPLAIELAAARAAVLSVDEIALHLTNRLSFLASNSLPPRHRTLRALIDWSYDQLSSGEKTLLQCLSVFNGGASAAAIQQICSDGPETAADPVDARHDHVEATVVDTKLPLGGVLDLLTSLAEKFLITRTNSEDGSVHFVMLETIREYAFERLSADGRAAVIADRHAAYFTRWAGELCPLFTSGKQQEAVTKVAAEHPNLLTALDHLRSRKLHAQALDLANSLAMFWWIRGSWKVAGDTFRELLTGLEPDQISHAATRARLWRGHFATHRGDFGEADTELSRAEDEARALADHNLEMEAIASRGHLAFARTNLGEAQRLLETALEWERAHGDSRTAALLLTSLTNTAEMQADVKSARKYCEESVALLEKVEDPSSLAYALHRLAGLTLRDGDSERARVLSKRAFVLADEVGNLWTAAASRTLLGDIFMSRRQWNCAYELLGDALPVFRKLRDPGTVMRVLHRLGQVAIKLEDEDSARVGFDEALALERSLDSPRDLLCLLQGYRDLALALNRFKHAARLQGAIAGAAERWELELWRDETQAMAEADAKLDAALTPEELDRCLAEGRSLDRSAIYTLCSEE